MWVKIVDSKIEQISVKEIDGYIFCDNQSVLDCLPKYLYENGEFVEDENYVEPTLDEDDLFL